MSDKPRARASLVGKGISPKAEAMALAKRITDPAAAREAVLATCLELMEEAAAQHAFISVAAFANILLRELPKPADATDLRDEDQAVAFVVGICKSVPTFRSKLIAALGLG